MSKRFERIPPPEQERIIFACLEEFSHKGYGRASTNTIVLKAGIPKGTLFYYFGSKKELFFYMIDRAMRRILKIYEELSGKMPDDLFERLLYREQIKLKLAAREPLLYGFFYKVFLDVPDDLREEMALRFKAYSSESSDELLSGLDTSKFRDDVDVEAAVRMIHLMLDGLLNRYSAQFKSMTPQQALAMVDEISAECRGYFHMIRTGIYR